MIIGICELNIYLPDCHSLKDKRSILKKTINVLRKKYNISISEIGNKNSWKKCILAISIVSDNNRQIDKILQNIIKGIELINNIELIDYHISII
ncbi:MAG: DUF503 domain-containing protein [Atribacterota bacterium]|nr:DUF503 domain-containing protein [Atribacterota bacterium]